MTQASAQTFPAGEPDAPALSVLGRRVEALDVLDAPAEKVSEMVRGLLPPGAVKDLISGTWLGHALHPVLSDVPIGSWQSAAVLDLLGGRRSEPAADLLIAVGLAASAPTALSGISDWADTTLTSDAVKRVGAAHAIGNTATVLLYAASLAARRRGNRRRGRLLGLLGVGSLAGGAWLGGHLSFSQGVGVDVTAFTPAPTDWTPALAESDLPPEGQAVRGQAGDLPVLLARDAGQIRCLIDACDHRGGPLHEGTIEDGCVTCPWHASIFRLSDGAVLQGPATAPQPALDVRLNDGNVEVRAPGGA